MAKKLQVAYKVRHIATGLLFSGKISKDVFSKINTHLDGNSNAPVLVGVSKMGRIFNNKRYPKVIFASLAPQHKDQFELVVLREVKKKGT